MSEEITVAANVVKANPHLRDVDMIVRYAYKALFAGNPSTFLSHLRQSPKPNPANKAGLPTTDILLGYGS